MEVVCYVCNNKTKLFSRNLKEIKSKHSKISISTFIQKFLKECETRRNINNPSNCICNNCLSKIYSYDWTCIKAKEQVAELRTMLLKTESLYDVEFVGTIGIDFVNDVINIIDDDDVQIRVDDKIEVKTEVRETTEIEVEPMLKPAVEVKSEVKLEVRTLPPKPAPQASIANTETDPAKRSKPIIVRVVKRVPFLKSKPEGPPQPNVPVKPPVDGTSKASNTLKPAAKKVGIQKQSKPNGIPMCKYCDAKFPTDKILQNHMKLHTKGYGSITCHICFYQMSADNKDAFLGHVKRHSKVPPKHCVICDEGNAENFDLRYHVQNHHNEANLLCDLCGKTFVYSSALNKHRKSHIDDRPEQCPHCPKAFKSKRSLKEHLDTHFKTEPAFSCAFCDKRFKRRDHCRIHERRHREDTKRFKCTLCTAAFEYRHDFNLHLQRKHDAELPHNKNRK